MTNNNGGKGGTSQECGEAPEMGQNRDGNGGDLEEKVALISDGTLQ